MTPSDVTGLSLVRSLRIKWSGAATVAIALAVILGSFVVVGFQLPLEVRIAGHPLYQWFGLGHLVLGCLTGGLGLVSWLTSVDTDPDDGCGFPAGLVFGCLWGLPVGYAAVSLVDYSLIGWVGIGLPVGGFVFILSIVGREDLTSTLPIGLFLTGTGSMILTGILGPDWVWRPAALSATFPASLLLPILSICVAVVSAWAAGKASSGFGTRGRQTGAYLLMSMVVMAVLGVLVVMIGYIGAQGLNVVLENMTVGAGTGLLVVVTILIGLGLQDAWTIKTDRPGPVSVGGLLFRIGSGGGLVLAGIVFGAVLITGRPLSVGSLTVTPAPRIGSWIALVAVSVLFGLLSARYTQGTIRRNPTSNTSTVRSKLIGLWLFGVGWGILGWASPLGTNSLAFVGTSAACVIAGLLAIYPLLELKRTSGKGKHAESHGQPPQLSVGESVFGSLAFLGIALWITVATAVVTVAGPSFGPLVGTVTIAVAAQFIAGCFGVYGLLGWLRGRSKIASQVTTNPVEGSLGILSSLGLTGAMMMLLAHTVLTGNKLTAVYGRITITPYGTIDWPFVMNVSSGLGIQPGVMPAIVGTVWLVTGAVVFAVPLAVGAAVYLTEFAEHRRVTQLVEVATNGLWSTPSIVFGLFVLAFIVPRFGNTPSLFAGQLALGFMLLPLVLITSREALQSVPDEYRDASAALGVSKWQTIRSVVIPAAMPGIITGVILGVGRIAGETAPILLVTRGPNMPSQAPGILEGFRLTTSLQPPFIQLTNPALIDRASALPFQLYAVITAGVGETQPGFGWGTALVLLIVVLSFYAIGIASRRYFRRKLNQ